MWEWAALTPKSRLQQSVVWHYNHGQTIEEREKGREREGEVGDGRFNKDFLPNYEFCKDKNIFFDYVLVYICVYCDDMHDNVGVFLCSICTFRYLAFIVTVCSVRESAKQGQKDFLKQKLK